MHEGLLTGPSLLRNMSMSDNNDQIGMALSSGIAAFEGKHFASAAKLLSPLADQGIADAQYRMAIMAQNGLGMTVNELLAYKYMKGAAEQGFALAQHGLGFMYMEGECVDKNGPRAVEWYTKAADQGMVGAMTTLGMMYQQGNGVEADQDEAKKWMRRAGFDDA